MVKLFHALNRSRRGNEADALDLSQNPPAYVGGFQEEVDTEGERQFYPANSFWQIA
jgi:hypothetical protein